jgi:hypothetical protein
MIVKYNFLFNFAATRTGGGLKRLYEYTKWFHKKGGACFIIHPNCEFLIKNFPNNQYFIVLQSRTQRLFKDCDYLSDIKKEIGMPDLYYSYGIPVYYHFGKINWFHLSNVLPLNSKNMEVSLFDRYIRLRLLGWKMSKNYKNADIISAESLSSLSMIKNQNNKEMFLSINGSDDEIIFLQNRLEIKKDNMAVIVGTQRYKALLDSYRIFETLKKKNKLLKLFLIGDKRSIPKQLVNNKSVVLTGVISQSEVIEFLKKTKYYISTTLVENSFNAASEGVIFASESYISDIAPHRELLESELFERVSIPHLSNSVLRINGEDITGKNIKQWDVIITEMVEKVVSYDKNYNV